MKKIKYLFFITFLFKIFILADNIKINSDVFKKNINEDIFEKNVHVVVNDIKIDSNILKIKKNNTFEFNDNVLLKIVEKNIKIECSKLTYDPSTKKHTFYNVKIFFDKIIFSTEMCVFLQNKNIITFGNFGQFILNKNIISSKNGEIDIKKKTVKLYDNVSAKNDDFFLSCSLLEFDKSSNLIHFNKNAKIKINKIKDLEIKTNETCVYNLNNENIFLTKINFSSKNIKGNCNNVFLNNKTKDLVLENNIKILFGNKKFFSCEKIEYNLGNKQGYIAGKSTLIINEETLICFDDLNFNY